MRLGIDVDGVLADWDRPFCALLAQILKKPCAFEDPDLWEWPRKRGFTKDEEATAWKFIVANPGWWLTLHPYMDSVVNFRTLEQAGWDIYFITARHTPHARRMTAAWLEMRYEIEHPMVILANDKGLVARALNLDAFIDDKPEHCIQVAVTYPRTRTYLRARKHNEPARPYLEKLGVTVTDSLQTMVDSELARLRPTSHVSA